MGLVQIVAALESRFPGLRIQDQDVNRERMGSIAAIAAFVEQSGIA
jgi:acyl carrier protein